MNLKDNKGYTGVDISVAMIIIMLFIPIIFGMTYNIKKAEAYSTRKSYATKIATEIIGMAKSIEYQNLDKGFTIQEEAQLDRDELNLEENKKTNTFLKTIKPIFDGEESANNIVFGTEDANCKYRYFSKQGNNGELYQIQVAVMNYYPADIDYYHANQDVIKKIKVTVAYVVGSKMEKIELSLAVENDEYYRKETLPHE